MGSGVILNVSQVTPFLISVGHAIDKPAHLLELVESTAVGGSDDTVAIRAANGPAARALPDPIIAKLVSAAAMAVCDNRAKARDHGQFQVARIYRSCPALQLSPYTVLHRAEEV